MIIPGLPQKKRRTKLSEFIIDSIKKDIISGDSINDIKIKYSVSKGSINNIIYSDKNLRTHNKHR